MKPARRNTVTSDIERARNMASVRQLTKKDIVGSDRIYYGHEFCERLLPDINQFRQAIRTVRSGKKKFSLLTPMATEYGLRHIRSLVALLQETDEVVVNDYGVLHMVEKEFGNPVLIGRMLGRIVIPALASLKGKDTLFRAYLSLLGGRVAGLETDYFNAPLIDTFLTERIPVHLYTGSLVWTTTRRCAFNSRASRMQKFCMCKRECLKCGAIIENVSAGRKFFLHGNTILDLDKDVLFKVNHALFKRVVSETGELC